MKLTEAYISAIPEIFLTIAISIIILNGLVGIVKPISVENQLQGTTTGIPVGGDLNSGFRAELRTSSMLNSDVSSETGGLAVTKRGLDQSAIPLGVLSLVLTIVLLSVIGNAENSAISGSDSMSSFVDFGYAGRFIFDEYSKIIKIIILLGSTVILLIGLDTVRQTN